MALEAVRGVKTLSELVAEYKVRFNKISKWKKQQLENTSELFATGITQAGKSKEQITATSFFSHLHIFVLASSFFPLRRWANVPATVVPSQFHIKITNNFYFNFDSIKKSLPIR